MSLASPSTAPRRYVALLRGINVGGNNLVAMSELKLTFEGTGFLDVSTYINSGNVIFTAPSSRPVSELAAMIEAAIMTRFGFGVKVLVVEAERFLKVAAALPNNWHNDTAMKCDVMFLWEDIDFALIVDDLPIRLDHDRVRYVPGAILWSVDRRNAGKSGMQKLVGTTVYAQMTVRNCNTVRKLAERLQLPVTSP